jgi:hypothetical protein
MISMLVMVLPEPADQLGTREEDPQRRHRGEHPARQTGRTSTRSPSLDSSVFTPTLTALSLSSVSVDFFSPVFSVTTAPRCLLWSTTVWETGTVPTTRAPLWSASGLSRGTTATVELPSSSRTMTALSDLVVLVSTSVGSCFLVSARASSVVLAELPAAPVRPGVPS